MSGEASSSKDISGTSSPTEHFTEKQQTQNATTVQQQSTSRGLSTPAVEGASDLYKKNLTFSGPGGTKLINSPETHEKSKAIIQHSSLPTTTTTTTTSTYIIPGDQQTNDQVSELSTRQLDGIEEEVKNNPREALSSLLVPYVDPNYKFPAVSESDKEPITHEESSKSPEYQKESDYLSSKSPVRTAEFKSSGNIGEKSAGQKRKLDNYNDKEQDIDQQQYQQQERSPKRIHVSEEIDNPNKYNEDDDLKGQDWKDVLYRCIAEYRKHIENEEKNLVMLINVSIRLQKLFALGVKSIKKIDEDMQSSKQVHSSDAINKYNKLLFDAMAIVEKDS